MFGLLYSLKTRKFVVPFTFDVSNRGFDRGVWTEVDPIIIGDFTFDDVALGFDRGLWSVVQPTVPQPFTLDDELRGFDLGIWSEGTDIPAELPFTLNDRVKGFDVGLWTTNIPNLISQPISKRTVIENKLVGQTIKTTIGISEDGTLGFARKQYGELGATKRIAGKDKSSLIETIKFDPHYISIETNTPGDYSNITNAVVTIGRTTSYYPVSIEGDRYILICDSSSTDTLFEQIYQGITVSITLR